MPAEPVTPARAVLVSAWKLGPGPIEDCLAVEQPLEIRVDGTPVAVTLRTPGEDHELVAGFLVTEGLVSRADEIDQIVWVDHGPAEEGGAVVDVRLATRRCGHPVPVTRGNGGPRLVTAACGACGPGTLADLRRRLPPLPDGGAFAGSLLVTLPERLQAAQAVFAQTGGLHASGLFDTAGRLLVAREDVGRHNAVDKVIGWAALRGEFPLHDIAMFVSGRAGFEIVQKAWRAGVRVLASVSAPSTLAVELATAANMTLVGFVRDGRFTVYAGPARVITG